MKKLRFFFSSRSPLFYWKRCENNVLHLFRRNTW